MSTQWVGCFKEHSTHATHMQLIIARSSLAHMPACFVVSTTLGGGLPQHTDVAVLTPVGSPAVPHQPVVHSTRWTEVCSVANQLHGMVKLDVLIIITSREDPAGVVLEGVCSHGNRKRSNLEGKLIIDNNKFLFILLQYDS